MTADQVVPYLGLRWEAGARGPDAFDCWGLLLAVRAAHFGGGVPDTAFGDAARELYTEKMRSGSWEVVPTPTHGDGVLMREGDQPHVGIYLDIDGGGILHCEQGRGVVFTDLRSLRVMGYVPKWYRIHG
jgi:cell wall-associated NlpC family hydrolase